MEKRRILLIGNAVASSYRVATSLLRSYDLRVFISKPTLADTNDEIEYRYGSLKSYDDVLEAMNGCDIVIISHSSKNMDFDNAMSLANIERAAKASGVARVIYSDVHRRCSYDPIEDEYVDGIINIWG